MAIAQLDLVTGCGDWVWRLDSRRFAHASRGRLTGAVSYAHHDGQFIVVPPCLVLSMDEPLVQLSSRYTGKEFRRAAACRGDPADSHEVVSFDLRLG